MPTRNTIDRAWPLAGLAVLAIGATVVLWQIDPNAPGSPLPACPFYSLTGLYCPGCGSTRCLHALVHGDLPQALAMNPLLVLSLPILMLMALSAARLPLTPLQPLIRTVANPKLWLWLLIGYGIARNLPWFPFTLLAPAGG